MATILLGYILDHDFITLRETDLFLSVSIRMGVRIELIKRGDTGLKSIAILTSNFFDYNGDRIIFGGGERYLVDLVKLMITMGYHVEVFQYGNFEWTRTYEQLVVHSIDNSHHNLDVYPELNKQFHEKTMDYDYHLYHSFNMCYPQTAPGSIAISHGVWWDSEVHKYFRTDRWYQIINKCIMEPEIIVSVDTNTISWVRCTFPHLVGKFVYLPNYVDTELFKPARKSGNRFTVLFPRSLVRARGWLEAKEAAEILIKEIPDIEFSFVGRGLLRDELSMQAWANKLNRVSYEWLDMKEMAGVYKEADVVLIPTKYAEGTSFSALEAMASGKAVIAGIAGGLTNLIINEYNGLLIEVTTPTLIEKIVELYHDRRKTLLLGKRARETTLCFSKDKWEESWKRIIEKHYPL